MTSDCYSMVESKAGFKDFEAAGRGKMSGEPGQRAPISPTALTCYNISNDQWQPSGTVGVWDIK